MIARNTCSPSREIAAHHHRNVHDTRDWNNPTSVNQIKL